MVLSIIFLEDKHKIVLHLSLFYEYQQFFQHHICFSIQPPDYHATHSDPWPTLARSTSLPLFGRYQHLKRGKCCLQKCLKIPKGVVRSRKWMLGIFKLLILSMMMKKKQIYITSIVVNSLNWMTSGVFAESSNTKVNLDNILKINW
jgi:hypothetical protein